MGRTAEKYFHENHSTHGADLHEYNLHLKLLEFGPAILHKIIFTGFALRKNIRYYYLLFIIDY